MSFKNLLQDRLQDSIDKGHYKSAGLGPAKPRKDGSEAPKEKDSPKPAPRAEKREEPAKKPEKLTHDGLVSQMIGSRVSGVEDKIKSALHEKFKSRK